MSNEEKILQLLEAQQEEFCKINSRLDGVESRLNGMDSRLEGIESRLDKLEESAEITRASVNSLLEWADHVSNAISFPLPKVE
ncbi:MAG: hypothetical protein KH446_08910 [Oscillibacter sp.]|jgi:tetrahydromethanopterin S-methyltransferase subunit G|uniref:hypothetical protein n=1 Tax=Oscillibacter sp. TaxID=1945593 RepID=UPI001D4BE319|nr:hypothetical protein [Oscillibacter sp.]MBS6291815.1 hypothetical protein [Oscillibacter sp.]